MKPIKVYLDTSIISFLFCDDAPDLRRITEEFFRDHVGRNKYKIYVSEVVLREIGKTVDVEQRSRMVAIIGTHQLEVLTLNAETVRLSMVYLDKGVIPPSKIDDAQHVAVATYYEMDFLLSWNFKHLANARRQRAVKVINETEGYVYPLMLTNPMEVMDEND